LLAKFPGLVVLHAGDGPERDRIEKALADRQLGRRFRFLGRRADTYTLMRIASVVCLTSEFEGTPNVLLESQYLRTPVVAFSVGGVPEAVAIGESGFVLADGDNAGWLDACAHLLADDALRARMGEAGRKFVSDAFSVEASCRKLIETMGIA
jgi:glycosyltransferase involved in cell wall biosynthesis